MTSDEFIGVREVRKVQTPDSTFDFYKTSMKVIRRQINKTEETKYVIITNNVFHKFSNLESKVEPEHILRIFLIFESFSASIFL